MDFKEYKGKDQIVEAIQFDEGDEVYVGDIVQGLYESGCSVVTVNCTPVNPQLEISSYTTSITFFQNGVTQTLFMGDYLVYDEDDNAIVYSEQSFLDEFEEII